MATVIKTYTKQTEAEVSIPDFYDYDDSNRGKTADRVIMVMGHNPERVRYDLDVKTCTLNSIEILKEAYYIADQIIKILNEK